MPCDGALTERDARCLEQVLLAAEKMQNLGRLVGGVAHDCNNLLTSIILYSDMLREILFPDERAKRYVMEISQSAQRGKALVHQLQAFSRRQDADPRPLSISVFLSDMEEMLRRLLGERIELVMRCAEQVGPVLMDAGQLEQVILNLVVNARDAMPDGGQVTITAEQTQLRGEGTFKHLSPGKYVKLVVSDTGCGIDEAAQVRLFEPFFTTKPVGKGSGLGLLLVQDIVKQNHGDIRVESAPGRGTSVILVLPRTVSRRRCSPAKPPAPAGTSHKLR